MGHLAGGSPRNVEADRSVGIRPGAQEGKCVHKGCIHVQPCDAALYRESAVRHANCPEQARGCDAGVEVMKLVEVVRTGLE